MAKHHTLSIAFKRQLVQERLDLSDLDRTPDWGYSIVTAECVPY